MVTYNETLNDPRYFNANLDVNDYQLVDFAVIKSYLRTLPMNDESLDCMIWPQEFYCTSYRHPYLKSIVKSVDYYVFPGTQLTVCCMTLINGFTVTGESACASPENFDKEIGEHAAYGNAFNKLWPLEGYLLKQRLFGSWLTHH